MQISLNRKKSINNYKETKYLSNPLIDFLTENESFFRQMAGHLLASCESTMYSGYRVYTLPSGVITVVLRCALHWTYDGSTARTTHMKTI